MWRIDEQEIKRAALTLPSRRCEGKIQTSASGCQTGSKKQSHELKTDLTFGLNIVFCSKKLTSLNFVHKSFDIFK